MLACKGALFLAILIVGGEIGARAFWMIDRKAPLLSAKPGWYAHYPQVRNSGVEVMPISNTDEIFDVLILGGSTISDDYGDIGAQMKQGLQERLRRPVRVFNLAYAAHNSRDSMFKHRALANQRFDLVIAYDGINDTRMNNAPPGAFREDYSHCMWYAHVNWLDRHPVLGRAALPFTFVYCADRVADATGLAWHLSRHNPDEQQMEFGKDIRTPMAYQENLLAILDLAREKNERVVLMTFAYHIPTNYSLAAYLAKRLNYPPDAGPNVPVELWGRPEFVAAALDRQNEVVRALAARHPEIVFVDQARLMPGSARTYEDCCHFTQAGCTLFTENLLAALAATK